MKYKAILPFSTWDAVGLVTATRPGQVFETPTDLSPACARRLVGLNLLEEIAEPIKGEEKK